MAKFDSLRNQFLIAMPGLVDPNFSRTVTLICEHNNNGAMGVIINRTLDLSISEVLVQLDVASYHSNLDGQPIYRGGPVNEENGFVVHEPLGQWEADLQIDTNMGISASREILVAIADGRGPDRWLLVLGYAGWGPGQLEQEIAQNTWLNGPADSDIIFSLDPEERWNAAAALMGVDIAQISGDAGHA